MDSTIHCPVCSKAGIPDFHSAPVVCPQCTSDLRPYFLLHKLGKGGRNISPLLAGIAGLFIGAAMLGFILHGSSDTKDSLAKAGMPEINAKDSSHWFRERIASLEVKVNTIPPPDKIRAWHYTVKAGDNFWSIASRYYGDGRENGRICADNGLADDAMLQPGQVLTLNPVQ